METFRRQLQSYFDPSKTLDLPWTQIIQMAAHRVNQFMAQAGDLEEASYVDKVTPNYLIHPLWPASKRPTIWYGQGETGKGQMAIGGAVALCCGGNLAGLRGKTLSRGLVYVDYEDDFDEFSVRVSRIVNSLNYEVPPNLRRFDPRGRLFVDIADQLKAKIAASGGADGVIIDSALPATGGDANAPEPVGAFFNALAWLNVPALVIAHETKMGNDAFPFGSQLWRTEACMTVNFQASPEASVDTSGHYVRDVLLRCTKANNVRRFQPLAFQLVFTDDEAQGAPSVRPLASTWIRQIDPATVSIELQGKLSPLTQLVAHLRTNPDSTVKEMVEVTGIDRGKVVRQLNGNPSVFASGGGGQGRGHEAKWTLIQGIGG